MIRLYSDRRARGIIARCLPQIIAAERDFGVPRACMQAILYRELTAMDWLDPLADLCVALYWRLQPLWDRLRLPAKRDSSTGYGQVFAASAIRAINYAAEKGIADSRKLCVPIPLDEKDPQQIKLIWRRLRRDREFNIRASCLCLLLAAEEVNGSTNFPAFTPQEMQLAFTRYNARTQTVTQYGRDAYRYYTAYFT